MTPELTEEQHAILKALERADRPTVPELAFAVGLDQAPVSAALETAAAAGWVEIAAREREELLLSAAELPARVPPCPERLFLPVLAEAGGRMALGQVAEWSRANGQPMNEVIKWGGQRGWLVKQGRELVLADAGRAALGARAPDELALERAAPAGRAWLDELGQDPAALRPLLKNRALGSLKIKIKERTERTAALTAKGSALLADPALSVRKLANQLTAEDLKSGAWRRITLRPYDVTLPAETCRPRKPHPMVRIVQETREAFLRLGFCEITSPHVESAFWDFDALFQPQDHPARDMQDTFYLSRPDQARLPAPELVERVRRTHEDGGTTGSSGWGYRWSPEEARRTVLRTHTTATTIRALAADPRPPRKVFSVGRVFRNEAISYKHLPEFTQVDGVIVDREASFRHLLGTLTEFYRQLGFEKIKLKPTFFPYTEPSAEVFVWFEPKSRWMELGGSGVFRPEVTEPLGCDAPVLAWGLGLERLAMLRFNLSDIRDLYWSDLDWVREAPLCR